MRVLKLAAHWRYSSPAKKDMIAFLGIALSRYIYNGSKESGRWRQQKEEAQGASNHFYLA